MWFLFFMYFPTAYNSFNSLDSQMAAPPPPPLRDADVADSLGPGILKASQVILTCRQGKPPLQCNSDPKASNQGKSMGLQNLQRKVYASRLAETGRDR